MPVRLLLQKNKGGIRLMPPLSYPTAFQQLALIFQPFYAIVYVLPLQMLRFPATQHYRKREWIKNKKADV